MLLHFMLQFVGCDGIIGGSNNDVCGVCGGNNSTCRLVSGFFTKPFLAAGYNYIADIPANACNLKISQMKETTNLIGKNLSAKQILHLSKLMCSEVLICKIRVHKVIELCLVSVFLKMYH